MIPVLSNWSIWSQAEPTKFETATGGGFACHVVTARIFGYRLFANRTRLGKFIDVFGGRLCGPFEFLVLVPFIACISLVPGDLMDETRAVVAHIACNDWCVGAFLVDLTSITDRVRTHDKFVVNSQCPSCESSVIASKSTVVRPELDLAIIKSL